MKASFVGAVCLLLTALANPGVTRAQERACGSSCQHHKGDALRHLCLLGAASGDGRHEHNTAILREDKAR